MTGSRMPRPQRKPDAAVGRPTIGYMPMPSLAPDPLNPRIRDRQQIRESARSIEAFGFNAPILINRDNRIVAGHRRLKAAKLLGLAEVPIVR